MPKRIATIRWTVEKAASEFQIDRRTLSKRIRAGDIRPGADGRFSTEQICAAVFGDFRREQLRELRERADKLQLENECTRKTRIPIEDILDVDNEAFQAIAAIIKASGLPIASVNEIFAQIRQVGERMMAFTVDAGRDNLPSSPESPPVDEILAEGAEMDGETAL